jgi:hypothetical protein
MAVTEDDVRDMLGRGVERVRQGWMPPRSGGELSTRISDDMPPLTTGIVELYLAAYAWLWERKTPPDEARWVTEVIRSDAMTAWTRMDYRVRHGVLVVCALWEEIQQRPPDEQDAIRELLGSTAKPGEYPELSPPPVPAETAGPSLGIKKELITTDDVVMGALNTQFRTGPPS